MDEDVADTIKSGAVGVVSVHWLLRERPGDMRRMLRRQDLERLEREGASPSPLLTADEAIALINEGNRSVAVLTYGWLSCDDPDPDGQRMRVLQSSLRASDMRYLKGLF